MMKDELTMGGETGTGTTMGSVACCGGGQDGGATAYWKGRMESTESRLELRLLLRLRLQSISLMLWRRRLVRFRPRRR